jgi:uncharacterized protein (DUF362 family)
MSRVVFLETDDRGKGVRHSIRALERNPVKGKEVVVKPNFNTADPTPGSTHNDTLIALVDEIWNMGARSITLGERSYPPTREVMVKKGVIPHLRDRDVRIVDFDDLSPRDWVSVEPRESHWPKGLRIARPILEAECLISTCCLKTHQYGGVFTMSLKLHVGVLPTSRHGYAYMDELHRSPHQQKMIAEINSFFSPDLIILDGIDTFVDGGPMTGKRVKANAFVAATDRVAIDAVGLALLKLLGSNADIMNRCIFDQEQIARAVELGVGVQTPSEIEVLAADPESQPYRDRVVDTLLKG